MEKFTDTDTDPNSNCNTSLVVNLLTTPDPEPDYQDEFANDVVSTIKEFRRTRHLHNTGNSELRFIVASATQAGKTRAMWTVCKKYKSVFVEKVDVEEDGNIEKRDQETMIIILSFSATDVSRNTIDDFISAGLRLEVTTYAGGETHNNYIHPGNVNSPKTTAIMERVKKIRENGGHIIWINDEADHSSGGDRVEGGKEYKSKLREFVRQHNIPLWDTQPPNGRKSDEIGFHVTATVAHMDEIITDADLIPDMRFASFMLNNGYSGLDTLNDLGVFEDNTPYQGRGNRPALIDLCKEWIEKDQRMEDPCYHILRSSDKKTINEIEKMWVALGGVVEKYDCGGQGFKIKDLSRRLDNKPAHPTLILLKQGFSRGSRIHTVDHIATCFDAKRNNDAAVIQSLPGRMTGRRSGAETVQGHRDTRPSRKESYNPRLMIWCDTSAIKKEIPAIEAQRPSSHISHEDYLRDHYPGMTGTHCKKIYQRLRKYTNAKATPYNTKADLNIAIDALGPLKDIHDRPVRKLGLQTMSKNVKPLAAEYLSAPGRYHPSESVHNPSKAYISLNADGQNPDPASSNSWKDFPYQGKWVLVEMDVTLGSPNPAYIGIHGIDRN